MESNFNQRILALSLVLLLVVGMGSPAFADLLVGQDSATVGTMSPQSVSTPQACNNIDYTFTGKGSGHLGVTNFDNKKFTVTIWSNTCNVMEIFSFGVFTNRALMAQVEVDGVGTATVTQETGVFSNTNVNAVGWSKFNGDIIVADIYDLFGVGVNIPPYDLTTNFGPVSGTPSFQFQFPALTDKGEFFVSGITSGHSFKAELKAPVGGELLPIDNTVLLLAAVQSPTLWWISVLLSAVGVGAFLFTRNPNNSRNVKVILQDYLDKFGKTD